MTAPPPSSDVPAALKTLRDRIDDIDHRLLELLAERNAVVSEVASVKRTHRYPVRDERREVELLRDRSQVAAVHDLRPEVIESLFRVVLWASRDRQAQLGAEVPVDLEPRTVAVIGGHGGMGSCFARLFDQLGQDVIVSDLDTAVVPAEAAAQADVVLVSVPIEVTVDVVREIGPHCRPDALLMDVTSTKTAPMEAMLESSTCDVIGTHPLFGPSVHSLQGQRIVLVPGRLAPDSPWDAWLRTILGARGLVVVDSAPAEHDEAMAVVQVLTHFATEVLGLSLARLDVPVERTLEFTSPVYLMELLMAARHFAQSAALYGSIQMSNPETTRVLDVFRASAADWEDAIARRDRAAHEGLFDEVRAYFGAFSEIALEQSSFLIDRLVERT